MKITTTSFACCLLYVTSTYIVSVSADRDGPHIYPAPCGDGMEWSNFVNGCISNPCADPKACEGERCVRTAGKCNDGSCHHVCMGVETTGCPENHEMGPDDICYPVNCAAQYGCKPNDTCETLSQLCPVGTLVCPQFGCRGAGQEEFPPVSPMPPIYPPCPIATCTVRCAHGLKHDLFGCQTCECEPCPKGEKLDAAGNCQPFSCDSPRACPEKDLYCANKVEDCDESGNPEDCVDFQCVTIEEAPKECDEYFGWNSATGFCEPTHCESGEACKEGLECVDTTATCKGGFCKHFACVVGEEPPPIEEPKDCPPVCEIYCPFGNVRDERGCRLCECQSGKCPVGEAFDDITLQCVPVTCESEKACPGTSCNLADPPRQCIRSPCSQIVCGEPMKELPCEELLCDIDCEYGHVLDDMGCPTCTCNECPKGEEKDGDKCVPVSCDAANACPDSDKPVCMRTDVACIHSPCPQFVCLSKCHTEDYEYNEITQSCEPVTCGAEDACDYGYECEPVSVSCVKAPCPQFRCNPREDEAPSIGITESDTSKVGNSTEGSGNGTAGNSTAGSGNGTTVCDDVMCEMYCENGFVKDDRGCDICRCIVCPDGEEYDDLTKECVPVSCESKRACVVEADSNSTLAQNETQTCIPTEITCVRAPCAQFLCKDCEEVSCACESGSVGFGTDLSGCKTCVCNSSSSVVISLMVVATAIVATLFTN